MEQHAQYPNSTLKKTDPREFDVECRHLVYTYVRLNLFEWRLSMRQIHRNRCWLACGTHLQRFYFSPINCLCQLSPKGSLLHTEAFQPVTLVRPRRHIPSLALNLETWDSPSHLCSTQTTKRILSFFGSTWRWWTRATVISHLTSGAGNRLPGPVFTQSGGSSDDINGR